GEHDVVVVAPDRERSAASHSLTLHRPLRIKEISEGWFSIDGTPTDCIHIALNGLLHEPRPEMVVAGINMGGNLGDDVTYSGTVAAAIEGTLQGLPSIAVSLVSRGPFEFGPAAEFAARLVKQVADRGLPEDTLLNVNVPDLPAGGMRGIQITRQGKSIYGEAIVEKVDPRGQTYFWVGSGNTEWIRRGDTDLDAVHEGKISVTPLHLNMTNETAYQELSGWSI
ncbi:MAG: 5'/3'-nucleotidase SurE, partial [bacterium]